MRHTCLLDWKGLKDDWYLRSTVGEKQKFWWTAGDNIN